MSAPEAERGSGEKDPTPRERFIKALRREPISGRVPHFELVMFLTMEAVGRVHPSHRSYSQWYQMTRGERRLQIKDIAETYILTAEKYCHDAIFVQPVPGIPGGPADEDLAVIEVLQMIRELSGDRYFLMVHGDPTFAIPDGDTMTEFSVLMYEEPEKLHEEAKRRLERFQKLFAAVSERPGLLDGFCLCSDYCFNTAPFFSREMFAEFIEPCLRASLDLYRSGGYYTIKHTDGNVMPILDMIVGCGPDAVHSLDPQGGVSLKKVKELYGGRVCLIGNVHCGKMQSGTEEELAADVRRALRDGMPGYGYIFSSSNCVYPGLDLSRYELMNRIWRREGIYR